MPLELRKDSRWWYGRYQVNGKTHVVSLGVPVPKVRPASLREEGNAAFERSRAVAQTKLDQHIVDARSAKSAESLVQTLHEIKYGSRILSYDVSKLVEAWQSIPKRRRTLHPRYVAAVNATIREFQDYLLTVHPGIKEASQVTRQIARQYMESENVSGLAAKSWNDVLKRLKAVFRFLQLEYGVLHNPFEGIKTRDEHHVHRMPLTETEVKRLLDVAKTDEFCRPLIVCGLSTAMRRGDCCLLKWADVHMDGPHPSINVKTGKTGETVIIPLYRALMQELEVARGRSLGKSEYVWPEQAAMHMKNENGVTYRLRCIFQQAGFKEKTPKPKRKISAEGQGTQQPAERGPHLPRKASIRDFHSLRTTWITQALSRGLPIETVKLISGHRTTEVVTQHYFRPNQEQVREAITAAMPALLTGGPAPEPGAPKVDSIVERMLAIIDAARPKTWKTDVAALRELLTQLKAAQPQAA